MKIKIQEWLEVQHRFVEQAERLREMTEKRDLLLNDIVDYIENPESDKSKDFVKRVKSYIKIENPHLKNLIRI